jgi:hypothetical protein
VKNKAAYRIGLLLVVLLGLIGFLAHSPLSGFARHIADADRVVTTMWPHIHCPVNITLTGNDATSAIRAVSSANREGATDACVYDVWVTFFHGTNELGYIETCGTFFILNGKKFRDDTGVLKALAVAPIKRAYSAWGENRQETR